MPESSLSNQELIDEVRKALGEMGEARVPDTTIVQQKERFAEPYLVDEAPGGVEQKNFDSAVIAYTAELSFGSFLHKRQMTDSGLQVTANPNKLQDRLRRRTDRAFSLIGVSPPARSSFPIITMATGTEDNDE